MSEQDDFRRTTVTTLRGAEKALHNGDPEPCLAMWSDQEPVTLFGAWGPCKSGWEEVSDLPLARVAVLRRQRLPPGPCGRRPQRCPGLHGRLRALRALYQRWPRPGERATRHPRVPPGVRRMEDRSPPRRLPPCGAEPTWPPPSGPIWSLIHFGAGRCTTAAPHKFLTGPGPGLPVTAGTRRGG